MKLRLQAQGEDGSVRVGGRVALDLGAWSLQPAGEGWRVMATVKEANPLWLDSGGAYELRLTVGRGEWRFRGVDLAPSPDLRTAAITGSTPPEE